MCYKLDGLVIFLYLLAYLKQLAIFPVLKSKGTPLIIDSLRFKAHKKLDGSTGLVELFFTAMLRLIACNISDQVFDSRGTPIQMLGTTHKTCKMELA